MAILWSDLCEYAKKMRLDPRTMADLKACFDKTDPSFLAFAVHETCGGIFPEEELHRRFSPPDIDRVRQLCVIANYPKMEEYYRSNRFPGQMLEDICGDFAVWSEHHWVNYNAAGIAAEFFNWAQCCLTGVVRQFGRLQCNRHHGFGLEYSFYRQPDGSLKKVPFGRPGNLPHPDLSLGDKCLNMHIPATGKLEIADCVRSMQTMEEFYSKFEPDYDFRAFVCYSWLLSPRFAEIMPPTSNIVKFAQLGHTFELENLDCTRSVILRIWGEAAAGSSVLPDPNQGSSMQRNVARYLREGGRFKEGLLIIMRDELPALTGKNF